MDARDKMKRGVILLNKHHPFFAYLLFDMKFQPFPEGMEFPFKTMAVSEDGRCFYDEAFVDALTTASMGSEPGEVAQWGEVEGVLTHEVLHVALDHFRRLGGRIPELANYAQDIVINYYVKSEGLPLPEKTVPVNHQACGGEGQSDIVLCGIQFSIKNLKRKSWEEVYDELHGPLQKAGKIINVGRGQPGKGDSPSGFDYHDRSGKKEDGSERSDEEKERLQQHWTNRLCEAAAHAKQQGKMPAGMERLIDGLVKPKVHWRQLLQRHVKASLNPVDWSWHKPHRKTEALGVYMPTIWKEVIDVEVIVDTSGSIGGDELKEFLSEIVGMAKQFSYVRMFVTFVDAAVQKRYELTNGATSEILKMQPKGGGGTRMLSGIEYIKKHNAEAKVVVVLTDGCDSYEGKKARDFPFEVVWCLSKNGVSIESHKQNCLFGTVVKIDG